MVRCIRRGSWLVYATLVCGAVGFVLTSLGRADDTKNLQEQKLKQLQTQVATEDLVQRIGTMLKVMEYYQPDAASQRKTLERVAGTLSGLSREQMDLVLRGLEKAAAEPDAAKSAKELEEAHARHVEIMTTLKTLLAEYENLQTLDAVAEKLDKLAKSELELALLTTKYAKDIDDRQNGDLTLQQRSALTAAMRFRQQEMKQLVAEQKSLKADLESLLTKTNRLKNQVPEEQRAQIEAFTKAVDARRVEEASALVRDEVDPLDDLRGSAGYKREMARVWTKRALLELLTL